MSFIDWAAAQRKRHDRIRHFAVYIHHYRRYGLLVSDAWDDVLTFLEQLPTVGGDDQTEWASEEDFLADARVAWEEYRAILGRPNAARPRFRRSQKPAVVFPSVPGNAWAGHPLLDHAQLPIRPPGSSTTHADCCSCTLQRVRRVAVGRRV